MSNETIQEAAIIDMDYINECKSIYDDITQEFPTQLGKAASKREREEQRLFDSNLVYGEITFETLGIFLEKIKKKYGCPNQGSSGSEGFLQTRGGIFYDLGSGIGKPLIAAAILHNFDLCCGLEVLEGLCSVSIDLIETYNSRVKIHPHLSNRDYTTHCQVIHTTFLNRKRKDWKDADVVFLNSTCYDDELMDKISKMTARLKKGCFLISLTKRLTSKHLTLLEYGMYRMSWGEATVYLMQKITERERLDEGEEDDGEEEEGGGGEGGGGAGSAGGGGGGGTVGGALVTGGKGKAGVKK